MLLLNQAIYFKTFLLKYVLLARNKTVQFQGLGSKCRYPQIKSIFHTKHYPVTCVRTDRQRHINSHRYEESKQLENEFMMTKAKQPHI
jgi:hypothetical protein